MNKQRRAELDKIVLKLEEAKADIETIRDEEQEAYDNMPENLQMSDRGDAAQGRVDALDYAVDAFYEITDNINTAME